MYIKYILEYRYRVGDHYEFSTIQEEIIDDNNFRKLSKTIELYKRIARGHAEFYINPEWYYFIRDVPLEKRSSTYWKVNAKELLPDKWTKIVVNGRKRWKRINCTQEEIF
jgi:hypothetical protein